MRAYRSDSGLWAMCYTPLSCFMFTVYVVDLMNDTKKIDELQHVLEMSISSIGEFMMAEALGWVPAKSKC